MRAYQGMKEAEGGMTFKKSQETRKVNRGDNDDCEDGRIQGWRVETGAKKGEAVKEIG